MQFFCLSSLSRAALISTRRPQAPRMNVTEFLQPVVRVPLPYPACPSLLSLSLLPPLQAFFLLLEQPTERELVLNDYAVSARSRTRGIAMAESVKRSKIKVVMMRIYSPAFSFGILFLQPVL